MKPIKELAWRKRAQVDTFTAWCAARRFVISGEVQPRAVLVAEKARLRALITCAARPDRLAQGR